MIAARKDLDEVSKDIAQLLKLVTDSCTTYFFFTIPVCSTRISHYVAALEHRYLDFMLYVIMIYVQ